MRLSEDFPHKDDLVVILDILKTYVKNIGSSAKDDSFRIDIHEQGLPLMYLQIGYIHLSKEAMKPGSVSCSRPISRGISGALP